ncbi:serine protease snk [Temnothorax americanus]|uniref:serine protease snk n=1 Tax=Temnothorax americanus TaxID=1964332 RepID=UPI0040691339
MDFCFNLVSIFLILDVVFIRSADGFSKNLNKVQLSSGIGSNPFLQPSANVPRAQNRNPFLQPVNSNHNKNGNPFLSNSFTSPTSMSNNNYNPTPNSMQPVNSNNGNGNPFLSNSFTSPTSMSNNNYNPTPNSINNDLFPNIMNNPFLNQLNPPKSIDTRFDTDSPSSPRSDTQSHYTPPPSPHYPISTSNIPVFNTPTPVDNDFTTSPTRTPPKIQPPISRPLLEDLIPMKISPVKTISELKCDEYVREIAGTTSITSLTGSSSAMIEVNNVCENTNRLVVGGIEARVGEFPHMVALGKSGSEFILMCGGTLISHTWVLSAAHCTYGPDGGPTHARIGFHRLADQEGVTVAVKNTTRHPDYKPPAMYADIALVQLVNDVTFSTSVRPACLYQQYDTVPRKAWISGWGLKEFGGEVSDRLQKAQLDLIDNLPCTIRHNSSTEVPYGVTPSMICAGDPGGNWTRDTCQGDSGGPLQIVHPTSGCLFQVIGVTSFGQGCAMIDIPGVYTRVSHYLPWIEDIVWSRR